MGNLNTFPIFFFFFFTIIISASAAPYTNPGFLENYASEIVYTANTNTTKYSDPLTDPQYQLVIGDLDGDGTEEIISIDNGYKIHIYDKDDLSLLGSLTNHSVQTKWSQPILFDWDSNGDLEIISSTREGFSGLSGSLYIIDWNGTHFNETTRGVPPGIQQNEDHQIGIVCDEVPKQCILVAAEGTYTNSKLHAWTFNTTTWGAKLDIFSDVATHDMPCLPTYPRPVLADWDGDNIEEIIFSFYQFGQGTRSETLHMVSLEPQADGTLTKDFDIIEGLGSEIDDTTSSCNTPNVRGYSRISNPLVSDFDGTSSNGLEVAIAANVGSDQTALYLFRHSITTGAYDQYPSGFNIAGDFVSNDLVHMDLFEGADREETICYYTQESSGVTERLVCGSEETTKTFNTRHFKLISSPNPPLHLTDIDWTPSVIFSGTLGNQDVLFTSSGTYTVDNTDNHCFFAACDMSIDFSHLLLGNASIMLADKDDVSFYDLYFTTRNNIFFLDDNVDNLGCAEYGCMVPVIPRFSRRGVLTTNPNIAGQIKNGTQLQITITGFDALPQNDNVGFRMVVYANTSNEQSRDWSANFTGGTEVSHIFVINETISNGNIIIYARDTVNPLDVEILESFKFTVGLTGSSFSESELIIELGDDPDPDDPGADPDPDKDNVIEIAMNSIENQSGIGKQLLWIIVMVLSGGYVFVMAIHGKHPMNASTVAYIGLLEGSLAIIGVLFGFIGFGIVIVFIILALGAIAIAFRSQVLGSGG